MSAQALYVGHKVFYGLVFLLVISLLVIFGYFYFNSSAENEQVTASPNTITTDAEVARILEIYPYKNYQGIKAVKKIDGRNILEIYGFVRAVNREDLELVFESNSSYMTLKYDPNVKDGTKYLFDRWGGIELPAPEYVFAPYRTKYVKVTAELDSTGGLTLIKIGYGPVLPDGVELNTIKDIFTSDMDLQESTSTEVRL